MRGQGVDDRLANTLHQRTLHLVLDLAEPHGVASNIVRHIRNDQLCLTRRPQVSFDFHLLKLSDNLVVEDLSADASKGELRPDARTLGAYELSSTIWVVRFLLLHNMKLLEQVHLLTVEEHREVGLVLVDSIEHTDGG